MSEYKWEGQYDDITCRKGNQILRVEQMNTMRWWWAVIMDGKRVGSGMENSREDAKSIAEEIATFSHNASVVAKHYPKVE